MHAPKRRDYCSGVGGESTSPCPSEKEYVRLAPPAELKLWSLRTETEIVDVEVCLPRPTLGLIQRSRRIIRNFSGECQTKGTNRPSETDRGRKQQRAHSHSGGASGSTNKSLRIRIGAADAADEKLGNNCVNPTAEPFCRTAKKTID